MAVRSILVYPHPTLVKTDNTDVLIGDPSLDQIIEDMSDTLDASPGVALAAPQIGYSINMIIVDVNRDKNIKNRDGQGRVILLNPEITKESDPHRVREGCLSVPEFTGNVIRYREVTVEGYQPDGTYLSIESQGFESIAFQHEVDHLRGTIFLDRVRSRRKDLFRRK